MKHIISTSKSTPAEALIFPSRCDLGIGTDCPEDSEFPPDAFALVLSLPFGRKIVPV